MTSFFPSHPADLLSSASVHSPSHSLSFLLLSLSSLMSLAPSSLHLFPLVSAQFFPPVDAEHLHPSTPSFPLVSHQLMQNTHIPPPLPSLFFPASWCRTPTSPSTLSPFFPTRWCRTPMSLHTFLPPCFPPVDAEHPHPPPPFPPFFPTSWCRTPMFLHPFLPACFLPVDAEHPCSSTPSFRLVSYQLMQNTHVPPPLPSGLFPTSWCRTPVFLHPFLPACFLPVDAEHPCPSTPSFPLVSHQLMQNTPFHLLPFLSLCFPPVCAEYPHVHTIYSLNCLSFQTHKRLKRNVILMKQYKLEASSVEHCVILTFIDLYIPTVTSWLCWPRVNFCQLCYKDGKLHFFTCAYSFEFRLSLTGTWT